MSYLIQVRGLKRIKGYINASGNIVVPYIGTWIETKTGKLDGRQDTSYLIQVRGLKLVLFVVNVKPMRRTLYRYVD